MRYTVKDVKDWKGAEPDNKGQYPFSLSLEGEGEPVDFKATKAPLKGDILKGDIVDYVTKKGAHRRRLELTEPNIIRAQWAIGQSIIVAPDHNDLEYIENYALALIEMTERIK